MTLGEYAALIEARLNELLPGGGLVLQDAMRYSVMAGGKRLRPAMLLAAADMLGGARGEALEFACAVEMIHTYSLIHDDLPGMDDDTLRRGRPTNHVVYGVGQAILAGDGLLNYAFETMLAAALRKSERARPCLEAIGEIARGAGVTGMIAGQCLDLESEKNGVAPQAREATLGRIHAGKTGSMFVYPLRAACRLCEADGAALEAITRYATSFGLLFQATDDLLDVTGTLERMGKTPGKDEKSGKLTYISVYGLEETRRRVNQERDRALAALAGFGEAAAFFRELTDSMVNRTE